MTLKLIGGTFKGRTIKTPKGSSTRPTQAMLREAVFNICQNEIEGAQFLDLFAGSGAMGLEALSRGATHTTFIEQNRHAASCIEQNTKTLGVEKESTILTMNAERALAALERKGDIFDLIYVDPPYDFSFDLVFLTPLLSKNGILFLEERHDPKKKHKLLEIPQLFLKDSRRFGIAKLSIFLRK